jgi:hypothetical protein
MPCSTDEVFADDADAGQEPHWVYAAGMSRSELRVLHHEQQG